MRLKDKVAVITGAASGIGRESAVLFAAEGARVVVADVQDEAGGKVANEIISAGGQAVFVHADVSRPADCEAMVRCAEDSFGRLDVLFNNAGISHADDGDAMETTPDVWDLTMAINVRGVFLGCKYGIPAMRRAGGGSVINTSSVVAHMGSATAQLAYTASKGAVLSMSRELAAIHAREDIRVNALCPGPLGTELLMKYLDTEEKRQRRLVHIPVGRFGQAHEIAKAALYLASDESSFMTGASFSIDGGLSSTYVTPE